MKKKEKKKKFISRGIQFLLLSQTLKWLSVALPDSVFI